MGRILVFIFVFLWCAGTVMAQYPQFSQFYSAPLYLNPAFAGSTGQNRVGINYRNQWPALNANFTTYSAWGDMYIESKNSGVGAIITYDREGSLGLQSTSLGLLYSYEVQLTKELTFRAGTQVSLYNRSINFDNLIFSDQFDPNTGIVMRPQSLEVINQGQSKFFPDLTLGGLLFSKNGWLGITANHLNRPNQSLVGETDNLPIKYSAHIGWKFYMTPGYRGHGFEFQESERSITPVAQYRHQGPFNQLDVGLYATLEPVIFGLWYRGLPFKPFHGIMNNEAVVFLIGFTQKMEKKIFNVGYSYDYTISKLGSSTTGGAHEISLSYSWSTRDPRKPPKDKLFIPCPKF